MRIPSSLLYLLRTLPEPLAQRSHLWALVRSLTHRSNDHSAGHHIMLTGASMVPPGFDPSSPGRAIGRRSPRSPGPPPAAQQSAARRGAARTTHPQHRPRHPRPIRRDHGTASAIRGSSRRRPSTRWLRCVSRIRVRPSGEAQALNGSDLSGAQPVAARRTGQRVGLDGRLSLLEADRSGSGTIWKRAATVAVSTPSVRGPSPC